MYKNNYILKLFQYMGVGIWGKKHNFIHSQRFKTIIKQILCLIMQSTDSLRNGKVLQSKIVCHTTALAEVSSLESKQDLDSKKDISSTAQYDKVLESKQNLISKQNLESCNFAPLRPTPTHLDKNLESKNCHVERSEISSQDSKKDFSLSLKMTKKQEIKNIKVKAVVLCLFSCMFYAKMSANGFKIQEQSLNATALSSAYVAGARGADASYYNPANMGFKNDWGENKHEFEFAFSLINIPGFKFQVPTTNQGLSSITYMDYDISILEGIKNIPLVGPPVYDAIMNKIPKKVELQHTTADSAMVDGSTGDTNFMLPKFFYKSKNYNGFTFGASFIAPSGLAMKWNGLGGEFLQDVFIFLIEFAPSISYTYRDRISVGFAPRLLYGMGKFNNIVYVPLGTAQQQNKNPTDGKLPDDTKNEFIIGSDGKPTSNSNDNYIEGSGKNCTPAFNPDILESLPDGLIPPDMASLFDMMIENPAFYPVLGIPPNATQLDAIKALVARLQTCLVGTAQVVQKSDGSDIGFGYRASVSARVGDGGMFSVVYNSPVAMQFKGKVSADTIIGGPVGSVRMDAPLYLYVTMPEILTIAYSHDWTFKNKHKLRLEATYERTFWSRGRKFDTEFGWDEAKFTASPGSVPESFSQEQLMGMVGLADFTAVAMGNGWVDTHTFRVGATYITKRLRLMLSAAYDKAPVPQTAIGIPDSNGYMIGLGAKYNFRDFDVGVSLSNTFKDSSSSIYASGGVGQLRIATFSLGYRW